MQGGCERSMMRQEAGRGARGTQVGGSSGLHAGSVHEHSTGGIAETTMAIECSWRTWKLHRMNSKSSTLKGLKLRRLKNYLRPQIL